MIWNFSTMKQLSFDFFFFFFLKFARKSLLLLIFCQMGEILKTHLCWHFIKCIVMGYSNGNESFTGRLSSSYEPLNILFHFFLYLINSVFHETFVKNFWISYLFSDFFQEVRLCFGKSYFKEYHRLAASKTLRARLLSSQRSFNKYIFYDQKYFLQKEYIFKKDLYFICNTFSV